MSIIWPVSLPQELRIADHAVDFPEGAIRTQMDAGPAKIRPRFTAAPVPHSGSILVTSTQLQTLWDFWNSSLSMGSEAFEWVDPRTGDEAMVRFTAKPKTSPRAPRDATGAKWTVQLAIEVLPDEVNPASPEEFLVLGDEYVEWGPWYRGFDESPAGEIDPAFRGVSEDPASAGGDGYSASGAPGAAEYDRNNVIVPG